MLGPVVKPDDGPGRYDHIVLVGPVVCVNKYLLSDDTDDHVRNRYETRPKDWHVVVLPRLNLTLFAKL